MKTKFIFLTLITFVLISCAENKVTGRRQLSLVSESEIQGMASKEYNDFLAQHPPVTSGKDAEMVKRVGNRISSAITRYYQQQGKSDVLSGYSWEFNLVNDNEVNAWCMPGGKVVVYTGLLGVTQNEDALAVVMGHEIAHAIARHGNERMSQGLVQQMGGLALQVAIADKPAETQGLFMNAYGVGTTVGAILPFSREQESEADEFGLNFSAMAGYNPEEAIAFWTRMSQQGGQGQPEFLSTHPSDNTRINKLRKHMPKAMEYYTQSRSN